jgi:hypothetical protein
MLWRHDIQDNDSQPNDSQPNDSQHKNSQDNDTRLDNKKTILCVKTFSMATLRITIKIQTLSIKPRKHKNKNRTLSN